LDDPTGGRSGVQAPARTATRARREIFFIYFWAAGTYRPVFFS
jgi:hypothetical protein